MNYIRNTLVPENKESGYPDDDHIDCMVAILNTPEAAAREDEASKILGKIFDIWDIKRRT